MSSVIKTYEDLKKHIKLLYNPRKNEVLASLLVYGSAGYGKTSAIIQAGHDLGWGSTILVETGSLDPTGQFIPVSPTSDCIEKAFSDGVLATYRKAYNDWVVQLLTHQDKPRILLIDEITRADRYLMAWLNFILLGRAIDGREIDKRVVIIATSNYISDDPLKELRPLAPNILNRFALLFYIPTPEECFKNLRSEIAKEACALLKNHTPCLMTDLFQYKMSDYIKAIGEHRAAGGELNKASDDWMPRGPLNNEKIFSFPTPRSVDKAATLLENAVLMGEVRTTQEATSLCSQLIGEIVAPKYANALLLAMWHRGGEHRSNLEKSFSLSDFDINAVPSGLGEFRPSNFDNLKKNQLKS